MHLKVFSNSDLSEVQILNTDGISSACVGETCKLFLILDNYEYSDGCKDDFIVQIDKFVAAEDRRLLSQSRLNHLRSVESLISIDDQLIGQFKSASTETQKKSTKYFEYDQKLIFPLTFTLQPLSDETVDVWGKFIVTVRRLNRKIYDSAFGPSGTLVKRFIKEELSDIQPVKTTVEIVSTLEYKLLLFNPLKLGIEVEPDSFDTALISLSFKAEAPVELANIAMAIYDSNQAIYSARLFKSQVITVEPVLYENMIIEDHLMIRFQATLIQRTLLTEKGILKVDLSIRPSRDRSCALSFECPIDLYSMFPKPPKEEFTLSFTCAENACRLHEVVNVVITITNKTNQSFDMSLEFPIPQADFDSQPICENGLFLAMPDDDLLKMFITYNEQFPAFVCKEQSRSIGLIPPNNIHQCTVQFVALREGLQKIPLVHLIEHGSQDRVMPFKDVLQLMVTL